MKKIVVVFLLLIIFEGCSLTNTPSSKVEAFLDSYNTLTEDVKQDLETKISVENLNGDNKKIYKEILTKQYKDLKYTIKDESIDGDKATVKVNINVYDLYRISKETEDYMKENPDEFYEGNNFSQDKFNSYKLENMKNYSERVDYEIDFTLNKVDGMWTLKEPNRDVLEKIHGLYNYETN